MTMRRLLALLALLALSPVAAAASDDSGAGPAPIIRIETGTHQGFINRIVALGDGHILTISDDQTARSWDTGGQALGVIRGRAGPRDEGALYAAAVSARYVALGGRAGIAEGGAFVRLLDRQSLAPAGLLANLPDMVTALAFSADGRQLAVGFGRAGVRVYALGQGAPIASLPLSGHAVNDLLFTASGRLIVSSDQLFVFEPDLARSRMVALAAGFAPWRVALSADERLLAVGSRSQPAAAIVNLADASSHPCMLASGGGSAPAVAFEVRGTLIVGGQDASGGLLGRCDPGGRLVDSARAGQAPVTAVLGGQQPVFADADGAWGSWRAGAAPRFLSTPVKLRFREMGSTPLAVSPDGTRVWVSDEGRPFAVFDLAQRRVERLTAATASAPAARPATPAVADLITAERILSSVPLPDGKGTLVGTNFYIRKVGANGRSLWKTPAGAAVWGVAVATQAGLAVAAQGDGTLEWYDLATGALQIGAYVDRDLNWAAWTPDGFFDRGGSGARLIGHSIDHGPREGSQFVPLDRMSGKYFRSDLIQAALRRDHGDVAQLASARQTIGAAPARLEVNAPPRVAIDSVCGIDPNTKAAATCFEGSALAPRIAAQRFISPRRVVLTISITGQGQPPGETRLRVAGIQVQPIAEKRLGAAAPERRRFEVELPSGNPELEVSVANADGTALSDPASIRIDGVPPPAGSQSPKLYVVAIGISTYQVATFNLAGGVASNDAKSVAAVLSSHANLAYPGADAKVLTDSLATADAIRAALEAVVARAAPNDLVVIFFSGHGNQIDGDYVFAPYELGFRSLEAATARMRAGQTFPDEVMSAMFRSDGISQAELSGYLARLRSARVVVVLDTCFGGAFNTMAPVQRDSMTTSLGERFAESSGRYVIASSRGVSLDNAEANANGDRSNSIFTSAVLRGLAGAADRDNDHVVTLAEIGDFIRTEVPVSAARFKVEQKPVISFFGDPYFPLYKLPMR